MKRTHGETNSKREKYMSEKEITEITKEEVEALAKELAEKKKPKIIGRRITREHTVYDFPIEVDVTSYGVTTTKKLEKGSVVPCWKCGEHFRVNSKSAFEFEEQFYLHCPKCESDVSVLYYFGKEINVRSR